MARGINEPGRIDEPYAVLEGEYVAVRSGNLSCYVLSADGELIVWGGNGLGRLGVGGTTNRAEPVAVEGRWSEIYSFHTFVLARSHDGAIWGWGDNYLGSLGLNDTKNRTRPTLIFEGGWRRLSVGARHWLGIKDDGTLWSCGSNSAGQLGLGDDLNRLSAQQVGSRNDWVDVAANRHQSFARNSDGEVWHWGGTSLLEVSATPEPIDGGAFTELHVGERAYLRDEEDRLWTPSPDWRPISEAVEPFIRVSGCDGTTVAVTADNKLIDLDRRYGGASRFSGV